jgi:hypothetical protein
MILTRLRSRPKDPEDPVCPLGDYEVAIRLLTGNDAQSVAALANIECLAGGHVAYGRWKRIAMTLAGTIGFLFLFPVLRGWGALQVTIEVPQRTKGLFSIHINAKPEQVVREVVDKTTLRKTTRSKRRLDIFRRFHRHMAGVDPTFLIIPARKTPYTLTVASPLMDSKGCEIIGHFFQEQPVRALRSAPPGNAPSSYGSHARKCRRTAPAVRCGATRPPSATPGMVSPPLPGPRKLPPGRLKRKFCRRDPARNHDSRICDSHRIRLR